MGTRIAIAAALLAFLPVTASADRVGLVVRVPVVAPTTAGEALDAIGKAGSRAGHDVVRGPFVAARDALSAGAVHRRRLAPFARAHRLLAEGVRAYSAAELPFAAGRLANARRVALEVGDLPGGRELIAEISLFLGVVRLELGQAAGLGDLRLASRLQPDREVTTAEFKPALVARYQEAARPLADRLTLRVKSSAEGSEVRIAGADGGQGKAPWVGQVEPRLHLVTVVAPGRVPETRLVPVRINEELSFELVADRRRQAIDQGRRSLEIPTTPRDASVAVDALLTFAELDAVLIASAVWRRGQPALIAELCAGAPVRCLRAVEVRYRDGGLPAAARELWARVRESGGQLSPGVLTDARVVRPDAQPGTTDPVVARHWAKNPYLWVGVGAGLAVAIATTVLLVQDDERRPEVTIGDDFFAR
jgi:hypothetical protein